MIGIIGRTDLNPNMPICGVNIKIFPVLGVVIDINSILGKRGYGFYERDFISLETIIAIPGRFCGVDRMSTYAACNCASHRNEKFVSIVTNPPLRGSQNVNWVQNYI